MSSILNSLQFSSRTREMPLLQDLTSLSNVQETNRTEISSKKLVTFAEVGLHHTFDSNNDDSSGSKLATGSPRTMTCLRMRILVVDDMGSCFRHC